MERTIPGRLGVFIAAAAGAPDFVVTQDRAWRTTHRFRGASAPVAW